MPRKELRFTLEPIRPPRRHMQRVSTSHRTKPEELAVGVHTLIFDLANYAAMINWPPLPSKSMTTPQAVCLRILDSTTEHTSLYKTHWAINLMEKRSNPLFQVPRVSHIRLRKALHERLPKCSVRRARSLVPRSQSPSPLYHPGWIIFSAVSMTFLNNALLLFPAPPAPRPPPSGSGERGGC